MLTVPLMSLQLRTAMVTTEVTSADSTEDPLGVPLDWACPGELVLPLWLPLTARHPATTPALQSETCKLIWVSLDYFRISMITGYQPYSIIITERK